MLELFKPLQILKDKTNPVLFDELGEYYEGRKSKSLRPFIIFYNDKENCYYYLKSRGAKKYKNGEFIYRVKLDAEILVSSNAELKELKHKELFYKDSYIDCSQIFKIDADLLEELVDKDCEEYKNSSSVSFYDKQKILNKINELCCEVPPNISILEVYKNKNDEIKGRTLYLSDQKMDEIQEDKKFDWDDYEDKYLFDKVVSDPKYSEGARKRYDLAVDFVVGFQKSFFAEKYRTLNYELKYYKALSLSRTIERDKDSSRGFTR